MCSMPAIPSFKGKTEEQKELIIERLFDRADKLLMTNNISQSEYDAWCKKLNEKENK